MNMDYFLESSSEVLGRSERSLLDHDLLGFLAVPRFLPTSQAMTYFLSYTQRNYLKILHNSPSTMNSFLIDILPAAIRACDSPTCTLMEQIPLELDGQRSWLVVFSGLRETLIPASG
jgi:hypothetical protein